MVWLLLRYNLYKIGDGLALTSLQPFLQNRDGLTLTSLQPLQNRDGLALTSLQPLQNRDGLAPPFQRWIKVDK